MPLITNLEGTVMRKLAEIAFRNTDRTLQICIPKSNYRQATDTINTPKPRQERESNALVIKNNGQSYADLLKQVKGEVTASDLNGSVNSLRQTRSGDLLIAIDRSGKNLNTLKGRISGKMDEANVQIRAAEKYRVLHIINIDAITTKVEVQEAVAIAVGQETLRQGNYEISNMRPARGSCQIATVKASGKVADTLLSKGKIVVGVTRCKVVHRQEVKRCYRCWGYGHIAAGCDGPDRSKACVKCAADDHQVKDCTNSSFCPICNKEGHRAGNTGCPRYRLAIANSK